MMSDKQEIVEREAPALPARTSVDATSIMEVISRAAADPNTDVDKLDRLLSVYERVKANEARALYMKALSKMQPKLPVIGKRGKIEIREKDASGKRTGDVQQATKYALWEDINEAITPILSKHGFGLSFRTGQAADGKITVTGILSHSAGHQEDTTITLMHDSTGSKNNVQAIGSSISYGKRYTATLLLNITSRGEDDDGKAAGALEPVDEEQLTALRNAVEETGADLDKFVAYLKVPSLEELPASRYAEAMKALGNRKRKAERQRTAETAS